MKTVCLFLAVMLSLTTAYCQDTLVMKTGHSRLVFIQKVTENGVSYKKDTTTENLYHADKADIESIKYQHPNLLQITETDGDQNIAADEPLTYSDGADDAKAGYTKYKAAATGTFITSLISPVLGLIPAIACSSKTPSEENLDFVDGDKAKQDKYHKGYARKAKKIKASKVWVNWGIGLGINIIVGVAVLTQVAMSN